MDRDTDRYRRIPSLTWRDLGYNVLAIIILLVLWAPIALVIVGLIFWR
jgi:hypothetical protein